MPHEKDVPEKHWYWCPKWYWPFAVCSHTVTVHKWCYDFAWVRETGYGVVSHNEGCENGTLYTWNPVSVNLFGSTTHPGGEMCFDSPRDRAGRCDESRTGLLSSGLSASAPYVSDVRLAIGELQAVPGESGLYDFQDEAAAPCRRGTWRWTRVGHREVLTAAVDTRFATVDWYVAGQRLDGTSGTVSAPVACSWPFPLPGGRTQNRVAHLRYEIAVERNLSSLRLYNDPEDGCFAVAISMRAFDGGALFDGREATGIFKGETCRFEALKVAEYESCVENLRKKSERYAKSRTPSPAEPVISLSKVRQLVRDDDRTRTTESLLRIMADTFNGDPGTYAAALNELEWTTGVRGVAAIVEIDHGPARAPSRPTDSSRGTSPRLLRRTRGGRQIGLGDAIMAATSSIGVKPCAGCKRRAAVLNRWVRFGPRAGRGSDA